MNKLLRFLASAAVGAAIGTTGAILLAPQSGTALQSMLQARRERAMDAAKSEMSEREQELRAEWHARVEAQQIKRDALS